MTNVAVTCRVTGEERDAMVGILGGVATVVFVTELSPQDRAKELARADVLISWSPGRELQAEEFTRVGRLRMVQLLSAGADHIPFSSLPSDLVIASNVGAYADSMAEHALAMILAVIKNLLDRHEKLRNGTFDQSSVNRMLRGCSCAILGFGGIGRATARLLRCFGVRIYGINTSGKTDEQIEFIGTLMDLEYVLRIADIILIALPLTNSTRGLLGDRELSWIKDDGILVNVARGDIIDEGALYRKLKSNPRFTAAIDAWWIEPLRHGEFRVNYPFLSLPNFLGSPHNSAISAGSALGASRRAAENVKRFLNHELVTGIVKAADYESK